jgi:hypothetical protein
VTFEQIVRLQQAAATSGMRRYHESMVERHCSDLNWLKRQALRGFVHDATVGSAAPPDHLSVNHRVDRSETGA